MSGFKVFYYLLFIFSVVEAKNLARPIQSHVIEIENVTNFALDEINLSDWPGENCARYCVSSNHPRICYFQFVLEHYHAMGP